MNLQQLEYIIALDEFRHFGKAAEHCNVSQPTLSTMIHKLEEELGVKIFDRSSQPIRPTSVGRRLLEQAGVIIRQAHILEEIIHDEATSMGGEIRLAILPTIAPYLLPRVMPLIEQKLPDLKVSFVEMMTNECVDALYNDRVDLAIIASEEGGDRLIGHPLYYEEFVGYVSRNEPLFAQANIRTSEIEAKRLWLLDEGHCFRDQLLSFCQLRSSSNPKFNYVRGSLSTFMNMVEQGNGMTFIPELAVDTLQKVERELVRPFAYPRPVRHVHLLARADFMRSKLLEQMVEIIRSSVPEEMHQLLPGQVLA